MQSKSKNNRRSFTPPEENGFVQDDKLWWEGNCGYRE
jgi:hypothetical protein